MTQSGALGSLYHPAVDMLFCDTPGRLRPFLKNEKLGQLLTDWENLARPGHLPGRVDFPPEKLRYLLGNIYMLDVESWPQGPRFRYRLFGSNFTFQRGFDLTSKYLDDHPDPEIAAQGKVAFARLLNERLPMISRRVIPNGSNPPLLLEAVALPLSGNGTDINIVLGGQMNTPMPQVEEAQRRIGRVACSYVELLRPMILHPDLARLLQDWDSWRNGRRLPSIADVNMDALAYTADRLLVFDVERDPLRFRYEYYGREIASFRRVEMTGKYLDQHPDPAAASIAPQIYRQSIMARLPLHAKMLLPSPNGPVDFEGIILPLADDGENPNRMLTGQFLQHAAPP